MLTSETKTLLDRLTCREKIGQLLIPVVTANPVNAKENPQVMRECGIGSGFQFKRPEEEVRGLYEFFNAGAKVPFLLCGDYECRVELEGGPVFGNPMSLAAVRDLERAEEFCRLVGREAALQGRRVGTRWTFAPVVDLNCNPDNPITNIRSFGDNPERVLRLARAFAGGCQGAGMAATMKHFPGDGMDSRDQHVTVTCNTMPFDRWLETYGRIFQGMIQADVWTCMIGHIALEGVSGTDPRTGLLLPATLDPRLQMDLLRDKLGFRGLIVSDAIGMGGMRGICPDEGERVVRNLAAGSDTVLFVKDVPAAVAAVERALDEGRLTEAQIEEKAGRMLELKHKVGLYDRAESATSAAAPRVETEGAGGLTARIAEQSVTLLRDIDGLFPLALPAGAKVLLFDLPCESTGGRGIVVPGENDYDPARSGVASALRERGYQVVAVCNREDFRKNLDGSDLVIYSFHTRPQAGRGSLRLSHQAANDIEVTWGELPCPAVYISMGNPYVLRELSWLPNFICCWCEVAAYQRQAVRAMFGEAPFLGEAPVELCLLR